MASGFERKQSTAPPKDNPTTTGQCDGRTIVVMGVPSDFSLEVVQFYFENRKSGGGPIVQEPVRDNRTGLIKMTFESAKDAENVLKKKVHILMGFTMEVSLYKPPAVHKNMVLISNVHQTTMEETLMYFLEAKTRMDVKKVLPGNETGSFLVYFNGIIDFEKFEATCKKRTLAGKSLEVSQVPVTSTILVKNVPPQIDGEVIEMYFDNTMKDTSTVKPLSGDRYLVTFKESNVTAVCSREHTLLGSKLEVTPYYELLESSVRSQEETFEHTEVQLQSRSQLTFMIKHKKIIEDQLKSTAQVIWAESQGDKLKLKHKKGSKEETLKILADLLETITVEKIDIPETIFEKVKEEIENMGDKQSVFFDRESHSGVIMGFNKCEVDALKETILSGIITPKSKTEEISLNQYKIDLLLADNFHVRMEKEYNGLKINYTNGKIAFRGYSFQILEVTVKMFDFLNSIISSVLDLPLNADKIINNPSIQCYLNEKIKETKCIGALEMTKNGLFYLYSTSDESIRKIKDIIKAQFNILNFENHEKMKQILSKNWEIFLKEIEIEFKDLYYIEENTFSIVTIEKVAQEIQQKFLEFNVEYKTKMLSNRGHFLFLKTFKDAHINDWCEKSGLGSVNVAFNKDNELHLTGPTTKLDGVEIYIEKLIGHIHSKEKIFYLQGFGNFLKTYEGGRFLNEIEQSRSCIILEKAEIQTTSRVDRNEGNKPVGVSLVFYGEQQNIQRATDEVQNGYEQQLVTKEINEGIITELPEVKLSSIKEIGAKYDVLVKLNPPCKAISVYGRKGDVTETVVSIQELLLETRLVKEKVMVQQMEVMVQEMVQWCHISDRNQSFKLVPFTADINFQLEMAFSRNESSVTIDEMQFFIEGSENMYQLLDNCVKVKIVRNSYLKENDLPERWSPMCDSQNLVIIEVQEGEEYDLVKDAFKKNLKSNFTICKVERIQNKTLYKQYRAQLEKMKLKNPPNIQNETECLWYGTPRGCVPQHNDSGLKFSDYKKDACLPYGDGISFYVDVNFPTMGKTTPPDCNGERLIYMCNVLTGMYCQGEKGLRCLPYTTDVVPVQYDSAVNYVHSPTRYVIFNETQSYPNYLITFK